MGRGKAKGKLFEGEEAELGVDGRGRKQTRLDWMGQNMKW